MTDAPDGLAEGEPERGTRRSSRVGDSGSPVGSTLSIVLAVIAVIAGFLILRAITDDDDGDAGGIGTEDTGSTPGTATGAGDGATTTSAATSTTQAEVRTGAVVVVANASGVQGSATAMSTALEGAGYTMGEPGNTNGGQLSASVVYYVAGDTAAQAVANTVAKDMGGISVEEMPTPPPFDGELGGATVLVMVGTDTAGKTLADLAPQTAVSAPAPAGGTTTTTG